MQIRTRKILHLTIWILYFTGGLFQIFEFYDNFFKTLSWMLIILLFLETFFYKIFNSKTIEFPFLFWVISIGLICIISGQFLNEDINLNYTLIFFRQIILLPYLYFLIIINERDIRIKISVFKMILMLFAIQLFAALIKLFVIGINEKYIGTISMYEGSLTTTITLVSISFLFSKYLYTKKSILLFLILLFIGFGVTGGKRATFLMVPIVLIILSIVYSYYEKIGISKLLKYVFSIIPFISVILYIVITFTPSLNPENKIGGSFDLNYAIKFAKDYELAEKKTRLTRYEGLFFFYDQLSSQNSMIFLFGEGAGKLIQSSIGITNAVDSIDYHYGVIYGGRMGIIYIFMQIGILGTIVFLITLIKPLLFIIRNYNGYNYLAFIGIWISFMMDTLFYSSSSLLYFAIFGTMFFYFAYLFHETKNRN